MTPGDDGVGECVAAVRLSVAIATSNAGVIREEFPPRSGKPTAHSATRIGVGEKMSNSVGRMARGLAP